MSSHPYLSNAELRDARQQRLYEAAAKRGDADVVDVVDYLAAVMRDDLMAGANVVRHEGNVVPITAARGHSGHGWRALGYGGERT